jgi:hypothetical protein
MDTSQFFIYMLAIMVSPLIAVQVSEWLKRRYDVRARRLWVFKTLMATRASALSTDHVQAINMVAVEFNAKDRKSKEVFQAWKSYMDHLATTPGSEAWGNRRDDLFFAMLHKMSLRLGYDLDMSDMRRTSYTPTGLSERDADLTRMVKGILAVLDGKSSVPISAHQSAATQDIRV